MQNHFAPLPENLASIAYTKFPALTPEHSLTGLDFLLLWLFLPSPVIVIRIRHFSIVVPAPAALVRRVILLSNIGLAVGLEVLVVRLGVFISRAAVCFGSDDFFVGGVDVGVVEGGLNKRGGLL